MEAVSVQASGTKGDGAGEGLSARKADEVRASFAAQGLMKTMGVVMTTLDLGRLALCAAAQQSLMAFSAADASGA